MKNNKPTPKSPSGRGEKKPLRFFQNIGAVGCSNFNQGYSAFTVIGKNGPSLAEFNFCTICFVFFSGAFGEAGV